MPRLAFVILALWAPAALAQMTLCASELSPPAPHQVLERFTSADCESCWQKTPTAPAPGDALVLDWVLPTPAGEDSPMGPGALRDASARLRQLGLPEPAAETLHTLPLALQSPLQLRVAHGLPVGNYLGTGLQLQAQPPEPWTAVLLLVEDITLRASGGAVQKRHLVRNMLVVESPPSRSGDEPGDGTWRELRPVSFPDTVRVENLFAMAWIQNAQGQVLALAHAHCK